MNSWVQGHSSPQTVMADRFRRVRDFTNALTATLGPEDCCIQSMPDVSPTRWHLAHTTWFYDTFLLQPQGRSGLAPPAYGYLFNSYYNTVGEQYPRDRRGLLSRPTLAEIRDYRSRVDECVLEWIAQATREQLAAFSTVLELGLQHEQQHQELMLTDIKHVFACNPLMPVYQRLVFGESAVAEPLRWHAIEESVFSIGATGENFCYDNESPAHRVFLEEFALSDRLVTAGEFLEFMKDEGYQRPDLWLSEGWGLVKAHDWQAPMYWQRVEDHWHHFTLAGLQPVDLHRPVCHVSYFEADAFARWAGGRLPTEAEWEVMAQRTTNRSPFAFADQLMSTQRPLHPTSVEHDAAQDDLPRQMFGNVWEWTSSSYAPYPGYQPVAGALGEYNGKFMSNQYVLRGGSCATSSDHARATYRNFFPASTRWQFSGIRLARTNRP